MMTPVTFYSLAGSVFGFSEEYGPTFHTGRDYPWPAGTPIPSFGSGRVVAKGYSAVHGHWVSIIYGSTYFHFCHMQFASDLDVGESVSFGDFIGHVGSTGLVTGPHLHLAASNAPTPGTGTRVDPVPLVAGYLSSPADTGGRPASTPATPDQEEEPDMTKDRPIYWVRKTSGPLTNSLFLIVHAVDGVGLVGLELDGRTPAGMSQVEGIRNQYAQYFPQTVFGGPSEVGRGVPFNEVSLLANVYDGIRKACAVIVSPTYPPLK